MFPFLAHLWNYVDEPTKLFVAPPTACILYDAKYFLFIMEGSVRKVGFKKRFFLVFFRIDHTHMCWLEHGMCSKIIKITSSVMPFPLLFSRQNSIIINTSFGIKMMNSKSPSCSNIPNSTYATSQLMTGANGRPFISFTKTWISVGILMVGVVIVDSSFSFFFIICHKVIESRHILP